MRRRPFEDRMAISLQAATITTLVAAAVGVLVPGAVGRAFSTAVVVVLVAVPVARVTALVMRWNRDGDRRFVAVGTGLVALVALGALLATLH